MSTTSLIISSIAEIGAVLFLIWGLINESKFVKFERKAMRIIKALISYRRMEKEKARRRELLEAKYAAEYETERRSRQPEMSGKQSAHRRKVA